VDGGSPPRQGLLIVNADDLGLNEKATTAIIECFRRGRISSATAMVWMEDSRRAGELAGAAALPVGLHLNLTLPFSDPNAPMAVRERQRRIAAYFGAGGWRRFVYDPRLVRAVDAAVRDQLEEFRTRHGRSPTHVDGHHHVHTSPMVLASPSLRAVGVVRPTFTFLRGQKGALNRLARGALNRLVTRRYRSSRYFFSIRSVHPALGGSGLERPLELARRESVELMVHPEWDDEYDLLARDRWRDEIAGLRLGSYRDL
jgi:predicted glycoside hydrolase/deacetylase ChbG (UPF0249 family)